MHIVLNPLRNHPKTVIRRFISAFCMLFVAPAIVYITLKYMNPKVNEDFFYIFKTSNINNV